VARRNETNAENMLTDQLIMDVLRPGSAVAAARFAHDVCGVTDFGTVRWMRTQVERFTDLDSPRAVVVGIAPLPGTKPGDRNLSGKAIPDAVICADGTSIVLEHKVTGVCERSQLIRHALHWALAVDRDEPLWPSVSPPAGYRTATWGDVRAWALRERELGPITVFSPVMITRIPQVGSA
jgi:hypothetical protein